MEFFRKLVGRNSEVNSKTGDVLNAQKVLESLLIQHASLIKTMRAYHQHLAIGIPDFEELEKLSKSVEEQSHGQLDCDWSYLVTIDVRSGEWQAHHDLSRFVRHEPTSLSMKYPEGFVRGFSFLLKSPKKTFELLLLDPNQSREAFDKMSNKEKNSFIELFGQRRRNSIVIIDTKGTSPLYVAIAKEEESGGYTIETIRRVKPSSPLPFKW